MDVRRAAFLGACTVLLSSNLYAQEQAPTASVSSGNPRGPGPIAESAERLAREWWPIEVAFFTIDEEGRPRFRTGVIEIAVLPPWQAYRESGLVPARGRISHQEMLRVMTPYEFSTPLVSASTDPGAMYHAITRTWRDWQERRIHERVVKELEEFERLRTESDQDPD